MNSRELIQETDSQAESTDLCLPRRRGGGDAPGVWGQPMQTLISRMDEQSGPTAEHGERDSTACDKP